MAVVSGWSTSVRLPGMWRDVPLSRLNRSIDEGAGDLAEELRASGWDVRVRPDLTAPDGGAISPHLVATKDSATVVVAIDPALQRRSSLHFSTAGWVFRATDAVRATAAGDVSAILITDQPVAGRVAEMLTTNGVTVVHTPHLGKTLLNGELAANPAVRRSFALGAAPTRQAVQ